MVMSACNNTISLEEVLECTFMPDSANLSSAFVQKILLHMIQVSTWKVSMHEP